MIYRLLLVIAAAILFVGGTMHAMAFDKTIAAAAQSNLPPFYANSFLALWLIDSVTMVGLGLVFSLTALRPRAASAATIALLALIPAGTAGLLYFYLGLFFAAHMLAGAAASAMVAAMLSSNRTTD